MGLGQADSGRRARGTVKVALAPARSGFDGAAHKSLGRTTQRKFQRPPLRWGPAVPGRRSRLPFG